MDIASLNKLTVPQLKNELRDRNLPLGGVKSELVSRLYQAVMKQQQQLELQTQNLLSGNPGSLMQLLNPPFPSLLTTQLHLQPQRVTTKVVNLSFGLVDPRDTHGSLVNASLPGEFNNISHEGFEWGLYCTKSMDYQVWTTVYLKCIKKYKEDDQKKRVLDETIPTVEGTVEFPSGKKVKGVLSQSNNHRLVVIKNAGKSGLIKTYGARDQDSLMNVKVTLKTLSEAEARQAEQFQKKQKTTSNNNNNNHTGNHNNNNNTTTNINNNNNSNTTSSNGPTMWGIYGQLDSDDEDRSDYADSSDYSSSDEEEEHGEVPINGNIRL